MKKSNFSVLLVCLMVLEFLLLSCGGGNSVFVGKWYLIEGSGSNIPQDVELLKDGTGFALNQAITWKTENNRLFIIHPSLAMAFNFKISGSRLDLSDDNGEKFVYVNMNKLGGTSAIVGSWENISNNGEQVDRDDDTLLVYNKDGTGTYYQKLKWMTENDLLYTIWVDDGNASINKFKIKGNTLTISSIDETDGGYIIEFKKK